MPITMLSTEWFVAMPNLTDIEVSYPPREFLYDFVAKLDRTQHRGFLPYLRSLAFQKRYMDVKPSMLNALSSRCAASAESSMLESFLLSWPSGMLAYVDQSLIPAFRGLVDRGMAIHIGPMEGNLI
jgi:hypothetical protein